jgi:hypothetical protein
MNEWLWSIGGMILTGKNCSTGRKTLHSVGGRWMNEYGALVEWYWHGKTEVLGEKHYTASVVDEWVSMEHWWDDIDWKKLKYWAKNITQRRWKMNEWVWSIGGTKLAGKNRSTGRKTCPSATLSARNPIRSKQGLCKLLSLANFRCKCCPILSSHVIQSLSG